MTSAAEIEERVEAARESLVARIRELDRRMRALRQHVDVQRKVVDHPLVAVGIAFVFGIGLGYIDARRAHRPARPTATKRERSLPAYLGAAIGALVASGAKELALHQLRSFLDARDADEPTGASM